MQAPAGVPCGGQVVCFDHAWAFVKRQRRLQLRLGADHAQTRVAYHWTAEDNFESIVQTNLKVPDPEANGIKKKHGAAFGRGTPSWPIKKC